MQLIVFGATGHLGPRVIAEALERGHAVRVFARNPLKLEQGGITVVRGDVLDLDAVEGALAGADAVLSALAASAEGTENLIAGMNTNRVRRLIALGESTILETNEHTEHRRAFDRLLACGLDWTLLCPRRMTDGERSGAYRVEAERLPNRGGAITCGDVASFMVDELEEARFIQHCVGIAA